MSGRAMLFAAVLILMAGLALATPPAPPPTPLPPGENCTVTNDGVEICDRFDNDCDGAIDEGGVCEDEVPVDDDDDDGGGGSSGGGGGYYVPTYDDDDDEENGTDDQEEVEEPLGWVYVPESETYEYSFVNSSTSFHKLSLKKRFDNGSANVTAFIPDLYGVNTTLDTDIPFGFVRYDAVSVNASDHAEGVEIRFSVPREWFVEHNASDEIVVIVNGADGRRTYEAFEDGGDYLAVVDLPAVGEVVLAAEKTRVEPVDEEPSLVEEEDVESRSALGTFLLVLGGLILVGGVGGFFVLRQKGYFEGSFLGAAAHAEDPAPVRQPESLQPSQNVPGVAAQSSTQPSSSTSPDQNLSWYVRQMRMLGFGDDAIRSRLENAGWSSDRVTNALSGAPRAS